MPGSCPEAATGCLLIDDLAPGRPALSRLSAFHDLPGVQTSLFDADRTDRIWDRLQEDFQAVRANCGASAALGVGTGCIAAVALAAQLPMDRLVLIDPLFTVRDAGPIPFRPLGKRRTDQAVRLRQLRRLARYAARNLSLCVADMLVVEHAFDPDDAPSPLPARLPHCRVARLCVPPLEGSERFRNCENEEKQRISRFLSRGELPKSLAENSEMCIIYG